MADVAKLNDWLQVVGMFGLIASLIFVDFRSSRIMKLRSPAHTRPEVIPPSNRR